MSVTLTAERILDLYWDRSIPVDIEMLLDKEKMQSMYQDLCVNIFDDDELVYLSDGVYLNSEGELVDTKPWR